MRLAVVLSCLMIALGGSASVYASAKPIYFYQNDARHQYQIELLERVLELTNDEFGQAKATYVQLPHHRAGVWALSTGDVDVTWFTSSERNVTTFLPIKIPIMQGLLGFRPILTTTEQMGKFEQIKTLEELKNEVVTAFGRHWDSLMIISHNGLAYRTSPYYQELFEMVATGQVDYMPRGLSEIYAELEVQRKRYPNLVVSKEVALYIPMVTYFFVSVNNQRLAQRIEKGLKLAEKDGSFRRIFDKHFAESIRRINALSPRVFQLHNPQLPEDTAEIKTDWWVPDYLKSIITAELNNRPASN